MSFTYGKNEIIASVDLTEVPAREILDKIEKGSAVEYDHVAIIGDLDMSGSIIKS